MSVSSDASGYTRFPDVEVEILEMSKYPYAEWLRRKKHLHTETLVSLIWQIGRDNGETAGPLIMEVTRRTIRISTKAAQGFDPATTELIVTQIEERIRELVVSVTPSKERRFLEMSFATAVRRETWKLVDKYKNSPLGGLREDVAIDMGIQKGEDDDSEEKRPRCRSLTSRMDRRRSS